MRGTSRSSSSRISKLTERADIFCSFVKKYAISWETYGSSTWPDEMLLLTRWVFRGAKAQSNSLSRLNEPSIQCIVKCKRCSCKWHSPNSLRFVGAFWSTSFQCLCCGIIFSLSNTLRVSAECMSSWSSAKSSATSLKMPNFILLYTL